MDIRCEVGREWMMNDAQMWGEWFVFWEETEELRRTRVA